MMGIQGTVYLDSLNADICQRMYKLKIRGGIDTLKTAAVYLEVVQGRPAPKVRQVAFRSAGHHKGQGTQGRPAKRKPCVCKECSIDVA